MVKTTANKLLIKPGGNLWVSDPARVDLLGPLPENVGQADDLPAATVGVIFVENAASARALLDQHAAVLSTPAALWIAYPKGNRADINRDTLASMVMEYNVRPITQISLDETWSALRFRPYKEGEEPFNPGGRS